MYCFFNIYVIPQLGVTRARAILGLYARARILEGQSYTIGLGL